MFNTNRTPDYPIHPLLLNRWSSRAFSQEPVSHEELMTLFEAARWAQSSYNDQPWRITYAAQQSAAWPTFLGLMVPFNRAWAQHAQYLLVVASHTISAKTGKPTKTHSFDTGAALQNMALQGSFLGIIVHGMAGFDYARAQTELNIPDEYAVEAMFAIGKHGDPAKLPPEMQSREVPSLRNPIGTFVFEGKFGQKM